MNQKNDILIKYDIVNNVMISVDNLLN